jgi:hypothetical protein
MSLTVATSTILGMLTIIAFAHTGREFQRLIWA